MSFEILKKSKQIEQNFLYQAKEKWENGFESTTKFACFSKKITGSAYGVAW